MDETILVVEDEPRVMRLIGEVLKAVGYRVIAVSSGQSDRAGRPGAARSGAARHLAAQRTGRL